MPRYTAEEDATIQREIMDAASRALQEGDAGVDTSADELFALALKRAITGLMETLKPRQKPSIVAHAKLMLERTQFSLAGLLAAPAAPEDHKEERSGGTGSVKDDIRRVVARDEAEGEPTGKTGGPDDGEEDEEAELNADEDSKPELNADEDSKPEPQPKWHKDGLPEEFKGRVGDVPRSQMFVLEESDGTFTWAGETVAHSREEFVAWAEALERLYPPRFNGKDRPHPSETLQYRGQQCKAEVEACWSKMDRYAISKAWKAADSGTNLPEKIQKRFRVDLFGNVVAVDASMKAVCAFEVDHVFPWSRGGCSRRTNFAGLYWGANILKKEKLIQGAELSPCPADAVHEKPGGCGAVMAGGRGLQIGVSVGMFVALFLHVHNRTDRGQNRRAEEERVVTWLTKARPKGQSKANVLAQLGLDDDQALAPEDIWAAFKRWQDMEDMDGLGLMGGSPSTKVKKELSEAKDKGEEKEGSEEETKDGKKHAAAEEAEGGAAGVVVELGKGKGKVLALTDRGMVKVIGSATYHMRKELGQLGFAFDQVAKEYWCAFASKAGGADLVRMVREEADRRSIAFEALAL